MKHTRIIGQKMITVTLALACVALVAGWSQWRDELRAQEYVFEYETSFPTSCPDAGFPGIRCLYRNSHSGEFCDNPETPRGLTRYDLVCGPSTCSPFVCK
jgi:hypothetical protein